MTSDLTVIIPAYLRAEKTLKTIDAITGCSPTPAEIIVHIDGGQIDTERAILRHSPKVRVITSKDNIGPGGARNKLLNAASYPIVASFDDDSFPLHKDFFARLLSIFNDYPEASIVAADITEKNPVAPSFRAAEPMWVGSFVGCGCAYRREDFLKLQGYVPLPLAYGCEEVDVALQTLAYGMRILYHPDLRVFHETDMSHHESAAVNSASIKNLALFAYLRYPERYWLLGLMQVLSRVRYLVGMRRFQGIMPGLLGVYRYIKQYRHFRATVSKESIRLYRSINREPVQATHEAADTFSSAKK